MVVAGSPRRLGKPVSEIRVQWLSEQWDLENWFRDFKLNEKDWEKDWGWSPVSGETERKPKLFLERFRVHGD